MSVSASAKPILRWAGSKKKLIPELVRHVPKKYSKYFEPFAGSAVLFATLNPSDAVISDYNLELVDFYRTISRRPWVVYEKSLEIKVSKKTYYQVRAVDPSSLGKTDRAVRFFYLNRYCFNGVYRTNKDNQYNVPMGTRTGKFPSLSEYSLFVETIRKATILHCDYLVALQKASNGDFVYLDPPYAKSEHRNRGEYGPNCFSSKDLAELVKELRRLDRLGVKFCLSYRDTSELRNLLKVSWNMTPLSVARTIASFPINRKTVQEVLVTNYSST